MRICLVYQGEFPDSERIEKTAKTLADAGHQVFLLCNNYGKFSEPEQIVAGLHVIRVRPTFTPRRLNRILKFPLFLNPLWIVALLRVVRRHRINALQIIDVPLSAAVLAVGRWYGLPVVYDMWENYPEALRGWAKKNWTTRILKNYRVALAVEQWVVRRVDHVFVVVEEARERLLQKGVAPERVSVVTNGVDLELLFQSRDTKSIAPLDPDPGAYKLLYVGAVTIERGLDDIIRALPLVRDRVPGVRLFIAGSGEDEGRLRKLADGLPVSFLGWVPFQHIHTYIEHSDLCLVPHVYNDFINTTIPNKLFQYMALGKPVLVSHAKPLARVVRECNCGFVFESGNPADAADQIAAAFQARGDSSFGEQGKQCAAQRYTWNQVAGELVRVYAALERSTT